MTEKIDLRSNESKYPRIQFGHLYLAEDAEPIEVSGDSAEYLDFWDECKEKFVASGKKTQTILRYICTGDSGLNFAVALVRAKLSDGKPVIYTYAQKRHQRRTDKYALPFAAMIDDFEAMAQRIFFNDYESSIDEVVAQNNLPLPDLINAYQLKIRQFGEINQGLQQEISRLRAELKNLKALNKAN